MVLDSKESYDDWLEAFRDLRKQSLKCPVIGVTDGAPGLIRAFEEVFPKILRQHCLVHKKRNILSKVPSQGIPEVKTYLNSVHFAPIRNLPRENERSSKIDLPLPILKQSDALMRTLLPTLSI